MLAKTFFRAVSGSTPGRLRDRVRDASLAQPESSGDRTGGDAVDANPARSEAQPPWVEVGVTIPLQGFFHEAFRGIHLWGTHTGPATCIASVQASSPPAILRLIH
jgi:hypothetical protein